ncbi:hypothetical protein PT300_08280 [Enterobacteriaceae bacterium ESL0689]|nr:hypothetical protein [Enterobacteriaceae bacterium ESL0689]
MITNIVKRYAEDISYNNEIANFSSRYFISGTGISALSWELPGCSRNLYGEKLLKEMILNVSSLNKITYIGVMVELSSEQPDSAIVNYKKTWGLLKERGVNSEKIVDKINFIEKRQNGLKLSGIGFIHINQDNIFQELINSGENIYFFLLDSMHNDLSSINPPRNVNDVIDREGIIFMLLGYIDEPSCEVVALGLNKILREKNYS